LFGPQQKKQIPPRAERLEITWFSAGCRTLAVLARVRVFLDVSSTSNLKMIRSRTPHPLKFTKGAAPSKPTPQAEVEDPDFVGACATFHGDLDPARAASRNRIRSRISSLTRAGPHTGPCPTRNSRCTASSFSLYAFEVVELNLKESGFGFCCCRLPPCGPGRASAGPAELPSLLPFQLKFQSKSCA